MTTYTYTALTLENAIERGTIQGWTRAHAAKKMHHTGLTTVRLDKMTAKHKTRRLFRRGVSQMDRIIFTRNMMTMLRAGLPLTESLATMKQQTDHPRMQMIIQDIITTVEHGQPMSMSLNHFPHVFSGLYRAMVLVGERSGKLIEALEFLLKQQEGNLRIMRKIRNALLYPILILITMIGIVIMMMLFVIPRVAEIYADSSVSLPFFTQLLIDTSTFMATYGAYALAILILFVFIAKREVHHLPRVQRQLHKIQLALPLIGTVLQKVNIALISRSLAMLAKAGVSLDQALLLTANSAPNVLYREALQHGGSLVRRGVSLTDIVEGNPAIYLPVFRRMVGTGEKTGHLDDMFTNLARYYDEDLEQWSENVATLLEPILLIIAGVVVGGLAFAVFFPLWNFVNVI
ncbi:MAG: type II secretion system F family protein [Patescibacteria group bacterium]|jgi:type II secretory pathway component PulF